MHEIKVSKITGNIFDLFWGEGWTNWERVRKSKNKSGKVILIHLAGKQLPKALKDKLYQSQSVSITTKEL